MDLAVALWCGDSGNDPSGERPYIVVRAGELADARPSSHTDAGDRALLDRIRADDTAALDVLLRTYADGLARYAATIVGTTDLAQDVVQDVFIKVWDARKTLSLSGSVGGYLLRMTRNRARNVMRHERSLARVAHESAGPLLVQCEIRNTGEANLEALELARLVNEAVNTLPPRTREVFLMRRQARLSAPAVAEALGISVAAVHVQLSRALHRIAERIAAELR